MQDKKEVEPAKVSEAFVTNPNMSSPNYAVIVYTTEETPQHLGYAYPDRKGTESFKDTKRIFKEHYAEELERRKLQKQIKADLDAGLPVILPAGWQLFITALPQGKPEDKPQGRPRCSTVMVTSKGVETSIS